MLGFIRGRSAASLEREAQAIHTRLGGSILEMRSLLQEQFSALQARAQGLIAFIGVVVTVTGFSGRIIAGTNPFAQILIFSSLMMVVVAGVVLGMGVMRVTWLTERLDLEPIEWLRWALREREKRTFYFRVGMMVLIAGFAMYCLSISIMLLHPKVGGLPALD